MATKRSKPAGKTPEYPWQSSRELEELGPAERVAHEIVSAHRDLLPSVERIMSAGLGPEGTLQAISLFRDSLSNAGDAHRDPRVAIERSRGVTDQAVETTGDSAA